MKFSIFFHIATMQSWKESFQLIDLHLQKSGILNQAENVFYCVNGDTIEAAKYICTENFFLANNRRIIEISKNTESFEFLTINYLRNYTVNNESFVLYIHTKCASKTFTNYCKYWIDTMCFYTIDNYQECLKALNTYDAVGPGLTTKPFMHFSGNFWWSKSNYTKTLKELQTIFNNFSREEELGIFLLRHDAEMWIGSKTGNFLCTGYDHIHSPYYESKNNY